MRAAWPLTMHLGPDEVLLALDAEFDPKLPADAVQQSVNRVERAIRERFPEVKRIYIEARSVADMPAGESIDRSTAQAEAHVQSPEANALPPEANQQPPASRNVRST